MLNGAVKSAIIQYFRVRASPSGVVCGSLGNHYHGLCITSISQDSVNNPGFKKLIRVITPLMERAFLSSRRHCEVILIYKSWLAYRMHLSEYCFRTIILTVLFGSYQHIAHPTSPDRWLRETIRLRSFTDSPRALWCFSIWATFKQKWMWQFYGWHNAACSQSSQETLVKQLFICKSWPLLHSVQHTWHMWRM